jgi:pyruvate formate lyase activating enzyme
MRKRNWPLIVDIKRHSLEDGPGIRSVVFFKGCPLRCVFCHNPETQDPEAEVAFNRRECIRCGRCREACPNQAIDLSDPRHIDRDRCVRCGECAAACPGRGLRLIGRYYPVEELTEILLRDLPFYRNSGGGVTLSGGECTLYPDYAESLLRHLKSRTVHIVLETSGCFDYDLFAQKILPFVDLLYYDIKIADPVTHAEYTGRPNDRILENFRRLVCEQSVAVHPRIPLVPGITSTRENLSAIVDFLSGVGADSVSLLPYNPMGIETSVSLGRSAPRLPTRFMKPHEEEDVYNMFRRMIRERKRPGAAIQPTGVESRAAVRAVLSH